MLRRKPQLASLNIRPELCLPEQPLTSSEFGGPKAYVLSLLPRRLASALPPPSQRSALVLPPPSQGLGLFKMHLVWPRRRPTHVQNFVPFEPKEEWRPRLIMSCFSQSPIFEAQQQEVSAPPHATLEVAISEHLSSASDFLVSPTTDPRDHLNMK